MHQSLARYSAPVSLVHAPSSADFITTMVGFKVFGTHNDMPRLNGNVDIPAYCQWLHRGTAGDQMLLAPADMNLSEISLDTARS